MFGASSTRNCVSLSDFQCPICRGILIEPCTLPCNHNLCLRCLKGTFEHNSLNCPLCRIRCSSWLRKTKTPVNESLWELIRAKFPKEVENKCNNGPEDDLFEPGESSEQQRRLLRCSVPLFGALFFLFCYFFSPIKFARATNAKSTHRHNLHFICAHLCSKNKFMVYMYK